MPPPVTCAAGDAGATVRRRTWNALGTVCEIQYVCDDPALAARFESAAFDWVETFEARYSRFRPDSLLSRINASAGGDWTPVDAEMEQLLDFSSSLHFLTQGVLDITTGPVLSLWNYKASPPRIPDEAAIAAARRLVGIHLLQRQPGLVRLPSAGMSLDFGGWGKEYAVDAVAALATSHGITRCLVDFGHDIRAVGAAPGKPGWHIGLEDPANPAGPCRGSLAACDLGIASSGDYLRGFTIDGRRYGHIIDPRTGRPVANGCRQVTVVASTALQAGALSTALFILGPDAGLRLVADSMGAEARVITDRAVHQTRGFFRYVVS
jgi:thiamine biosynthesis lipoprotein